MLLLSVTSIMVPINNCGEKFKRSIVGKICKIRWNAIRLGFSKSEINQGESATQWDKSPAGFASQFRWEIRNQQEVLTINDGNAPYNNRFNPTQRGRHALCSCGSKRSVVRQRSRRNPLLLVLSRPSKRGPQLRGLIERYTDGINRWTARNQNTLKSNRF